jgi:hypothetical protein
MVEVQGSNVRLYLEGLMLLALDDENKRLEAGILNVDDEHNLKVRTFSRKSAKPGACSEEVWKEGEPEYIPDRDIRLYELGEITVLCPGGESKNIVSPIVPRNREVWMPFNLIPDFEDIVGSRVKLDKSKVKPVLSITGGNFFSVLRPDHVENEKPLEKRADTRGFIQTYRLEKDQLRDFKTKASREIVSIEELVTLGVTAKDLGIRSYTAATMITLNEGEELVCVLKSEQGEQRELFRVKYALNREAKVVLENGVTQHEEGAHVHSHPEGEKSDLMHFFHFLHYYEAIKKIKEKKQFLLANEEMLVEFLKNDTENEVETLQTEEAGSPTGGNDPECPAARMSMGLFPD